MSRYRPQSDRKDSVKGLVGAENDLTLSRLIQIIYLADWKASIDRSRQITDIKWQMVNGEPKMDDSSLDQMIDFVEANSKGETLGSLFQNFYEGKFGKTKLIQAEKSILDFVIEKALVKSSEEFTQLVHSTFPSLTLDETDKVDLPDLAKTYVEEVRPELARESGLRLKA
jgi:hypothetical protein